jgi:hypothetical protein
MLRLELLCCVLAREYGQIAVKYMQAQPVFCTSVESHFDA